MKKALLLILMLVTTGLNAQSSYGFKVDSASVLNWSGGIAGRMGTKYTVYLSWKVKAPKFTIDSIWSNGYGYAINYSYERGKLRDKRPARGTLRKSKAILFAEDKSTYIPNYNNSTGNMLAKPLANPPKNYSGEALIRYILPNGKKKYIVVGKYTTTRSVNYP